LSGLVQGSAPNEDLQNTTVSATTKKHKYHIKVAGTSISAYKKCMCTVADHKS
jgi:hypothetical protein